jgi:hypothetical protein
VFPINNPYITSPKRSDDLPDASQPRREAPQAIKPHRFLVTTGIKRPAGCTPGTGRSYSLIVNPLAFGSGSGGLLPDWSKQQLFLR